MLKDIINIILKLHILFLPLCNLHFNIDYVLQFTMEYLMCVDIFEQRIWRKQDAQLEIDRL